MDYETFLKTSLVTVLVMAGLSYCSYSADIRALKSENLSLIDTNIALQQQLMSAKGSVKEPSADESTASGAERRQDGKGQHLVRGGFSIAVSPGDDDGLCTLIKLEEQVLLEECKSRQSRYTLLNDQAFGAMTFKEEWSQGSDQGGHTSGVTIWGIHDQELLQHVNLVTARTLPACESPDDDREECRHERWLRASLSISDDRNPAVQYRYLTSSGQAGEVSYVWKEGRFHLNGKDIPADIAKEYGL